MSDEASFGPREAQPLSGVQAYAAAQGWEFFADKLNGPDVGARSASTVALEADAEQLGKDAAALFDTRQGRAVLEWLCDITVRRPSWFFGLPRDQAELYMAMREGQNGLLVTLLKLIASGRDEKQPQRQGVE